MSYSNGPRIITNGLVSYLDAGNIKSYSGTGTTWVDITGNSKNCTLYNSPIYSTFNKGYFNFDGINDYGIINHSTAGNSFSVDIWFNISSLPPLGEYTFLLSYGDSYYDWALAFYDTQLYIFYEGLTADEIISPPIVTNTWYNFHLIYNSSSTLSSFYLNNNFLGSLSMSIPANYTNIIVGSSSSVSPEYLYNGKISSIKLYNNILSSDEIRQNYNVIKGRYSL